jgi:DNA-binding IclR family transcriptional regulator
MQQFADRLLQTAAMAEGVLHPDEILGALMGVALSYSMRHNPHGELVALLREAASRLEQVDGPRTIN